MVVSLGKSGALDLKHWDTHCKKVLGRKVKMTFNGGEQLSRVDLWRLGFVKAAENYWEIDAAIKQPPPPKRYAQKRL